MRDLCLQRRQAIQELIAMVRSKGIPIIYTTSETRKEAKPKTVHATNRRVDEIGQSAYDIYHDFKPEVGDLIIYKERASGFFGTSLIAHLTRMGISSLIVCGETPAVAFAPVQWMPIPMDFTRPWLKNVALIGACCPTR